MQDATESRAAYDVSVANSQYDGIRVCGAKAAASERNALWRLEGLE
jgi:hypothetical protein